MSQKNTLRSLKPKLPSLKPALASLKPTLRSIKQTVAPITNILNSSTKSTGTFAFITNLCPQAKLYGIINLIVIILGIIILGNNGVGGLIYNVVLSVFWVWIVSGLCVKGWNKLAWTVTILSSFGLLVLIIVQMVWGNAALKEYIEKEQKAKNNTPPPTNRR